MIFKVGDKVKQIRHNHHNPGNPYATITKIEYHSDGLVDIYHIHEGEKTEKSIGYVTEKEMETCFELTKYSKIIERFKKRGGEWNDVQDTQDESRQDKASV